MTVRIHALLGVLGALLVHAPASAAENAQEQPAALPAPVAISDLVRDNVTALQRRAAEDERAYEDRKSVV